MSNPMNWVRRDVRVAHARALDLTSKDDDQRPTVHASVYLVRSGALGRLRCFMNGYMVDLDWTTGEGGQDVLRQDGVADGEGGSLAQRISKEDMDWLIEGWGK